MPVARNRDLQTAEQYARELFRADPKMHIDEAARLVNESCRRGLVKHVLSGIRREIRQKQPVAVVPATAAMETATMTAARTMQQAAIAGASSEARAQKDERVKFLETWALEHPLATYEEAREAVKERFGMAVGTKIISDTLRMAKQLWEAQRLEAIEKQRAVEVPVAPSGDRNQRLTMIAQSMIAEGVRLMEVLDDGRVRVELKNVVTT